MNRDDLTHYTPDTCNCSRTGRRLRGADVRVEREHDLWHKQQAKKEDR